MIEETNIRPDATIDTLKVGDKEGGIFRTHPDPPAAKDDFEERFDLLEI